MVQLMSASREELIERHLIDLESLTPELEGTAVISVEGLMIASRLPNGLTDDLVASMSAAMLALGERIAHDLQRGELSQVFIRGEVGYVLLIAVNENAVLTALASEEAKLGLLFLDMKRAASELRQLV